MWIAEPSSEAHENAAPKVIHTLQRPDAETSEAVIALCRRVDAYNIGSIRSLSRVKVKPASCLLQSSNGPTACRFILRLTGPRGGTEIRFLGTFIKTNNASCCRGVVQSSLIEGSRRGQRSGFGINPAHRQSATLQTRQNPVTAKTTLFPPVTN